MATTQHDFEIVQGETWEKIVRWESSTVAFKAITGITRAAPPVLTVPGHGLVDGWRAAVANVSGMRQINARSTPPKAKDYHIVEVVDTDTITFPNLDASGYSPYLTGGVLRYFQPVDMTDATARMHIRATLAAEETILELTTENSRIIIDDAAKTILLVLTAEETEALSFAAAVYDLEVVESDGTVHRVLEGSLSLRKEVTRQEA